MIFCRHRWKREGVRRIENLCRRHIWKTRLASAAARIFLFTLINDFREHCSPALLRRRRRHFALPPSFASRHFLQINNLSGRPIWSTVPSSLSLPTYLPVSISCSLIFLKQLLGKELCKPAKLVREMSTSEIQECKVL